MRIFLVRITFVAGFLFGVLLGLLFFPKEKTSFNQRPRSKSKYEIWFAQQKLKRNSIPTDKLHYSNFSYLTESKYLLKNIHILCLILVHHINYATASAMTWAKGCTQVQLLNLKRKKIAFKYNKKEAAWPLLCNTLVNISDSFHWILVVKDNTFVIIENIRYLVAPLNHSSQYYLGHSIKFWGATYNVGEAGYLISNGTLSALKHYRATNLCSTNSIVWNLEDYYLGKALNNLSINVSDTRDDVGLATFHGFNLQWLFFPGSNIISNYYRFTIYPTRCCSSKSVTFQVSSSNSMYTYDYILNTLQLFTSKTLINRKPYSEASDDEVWKAVLRKHGRINTNVSSQEYYEFWVDLVSDPILFAQKIKKSN